jgi:thiamine-monophosphate kinase
MKEDKFINIIKNMLPESSSYIGDDTAFIEEKGLILTQDTLVEDVHFSMELITPSDLGIKAVAVNLSDIAASGGTAKFILISLSLPENIDEIFIRDFYKGVNEICKKYNILVIGGDLTRASKIMISIAAIGYNEGLNPAKRNLARIDDLVITIGEFGSSAAGLWLLQNNNCIIPDDIKKKFIKTHINPVPLLKEGREILKYSENKTPALMDASDGLADALYKISLASEVSMEIDFDKIPIDNNLNLVAKTASINPFKWIFYGGEDYALVGAVSKEVCEKLIANNVDINVIGKVIKKIEQSEILIMYNKETMKINSETIDNEIFKHFM